MNKRMVATAAFMAVWLGASASAQAADADVEALKQELAAQRKLIEQLLAERAGPPATPTTASDVDKQLRSAQRGPVNEPAAAPVGAPPPPPPIRFYGIADVSVAAANSGYGTKVRIEGGGGKTASRVGVQATKVVSNIKISAVAEAGVLFDTGVTGNGAATNGINDASASSGGALGTGPQIFGRQIWAGFDAGFGQVSIGRQYVGSYIVAGVVGSAVGDGLYGATAALTILPGGMPVRFNNSVVWSTPEVSHVRGILSVSTGAENNTSGTAAVGTTTTNSRAGQGYDLAGIYSSGPTQISATTWTVHNASYVTTGETGLAIKRGYQLAGNYDFGAFRWFGDFVHGTINGGNYQNVTKTLSSSNAYGTSVLIPFGKSKVELTATRLDDKSKLNRDGTLYGVSYWYDLSAETTFYVTAGKMANNHNAGYTLTDAANLVGNAVRPGYSPSGLEGGMTYKF